MTIEAHAKSEVLFPGFYRERPTDRVGGCGGAAGRDRRTGIGAVFQFPFLRRTAPASTRAAATWRRIWRRRRLAGRRSVRAIPAAGAETRGARGFFARAVAGAARDRAGAQCAGARRRHGGLARLRS